MLKLAIITYVEEGLQRNKKKKFNLFCLFSFLFFSKENTIVQEWECKVFYRESVNKLYFFYFIHFLLLPPHPPFLVLEETQKVIFL